MDFHKKRAIFSIQRNNKKREAIINTKRKALIESTSIQEQGGLAKKIMRRVVDLEREEPIWKFIHEECELDDLPELIEKLQDCQQELELHQCIIGIRKVLAQAHQSESLWEIALEIIEKECIHKIISLLSSENYPQVQLQALSILSYISLVDEHCEFLANQTSVLEGVCQVLHRQIPEILLQSIWFLGNLAKTNDSLFQRVILGKKESIIQILKIGVKYPEIQLKGAILWLIKLLGQKHKKIQDSMLSQGLLEAAMNYVLAISDDFLYQLPQKEIQIANDYLWSVIFLSQVFGEGFSQSIRQKKIVQFLVQLIEFRIKSSSGAMKNQKVIAIRVLGVLSFNCSDIDNEIIEKGFLDIICPLISVINCNLLDQELSWLLSNIVTNPIAKVTILRHPIFKDLVEWLFRAKQSLISIEHLCWLFIHLYRQIPENIEGTQAYGLMDSVYENIVEKLQNGTLKGEQVALEILNNLKMASEHSNTKSQGKIRDLTDKVELLMTNN